MYTPEQVEQLALECETGPSQAAVRHKTIAKIMRAYAATLKAAQGGVTEAMVERAREAYFNAARVSDGVFTGPTAMRAALEAALSAPEPAAQGEAVAWQYRRLDEEEGPSPYWHHMTREQYEMFRDNPRSNCEVRQLFTAPPAQPAERVPEGTWLWCKLMDWCKARRVPPAEYSDLFAIAGEAHKLAASPAAPADGDGKECAHKWVAKLGHENAGQRCDWCGETRP